MTAAQRAMRRWNEDRPWLVDLALGGGLTLFNMATVVSRHPTPALWAVALWGAQTLPLLIRRSHPGTALAAMTALYALFQALDPIPNKVPGPFLLMVGVYAVARYSTPGRSLLGMLLCLEVAMAADVLSGHWQQPNLGSLEPIGLTTFVFFFALAWILGSGRRRIGADAEQLRDLNARLWAEQEANARQAVLAERSRIARDLHDVVAHHVSAIAVQARAVEDVLDEDPALAGNSIGLIAHTADTALVEMRRALGLLSPPDRELAPEPSLEHLDTLVDAAAAAGCQVTCRIATEELPPDAVGIRVVAYRIVQEALTNVLKHAGPVGVTIDVRADKSALVVTVTNEPETEHQPVPGAGRGLLGMRERVAAFGGTLEAGPRADGGWQVRAVLRATEHRAVEAIA